MKKSFTLSARSIWRRPFVRFAVGLLAVTACVSCQTSTTSLAWNAKDAGPGEYRRVARHFIEAVDATLRSLDRAIEPAARNPQRAILKFADAVDTLEVDSMAARARAEAMRARGQAYFATWQEHLAVVKDERVRALALEHQVELGNHFEEIRSTAQHLREIFRPFLTDLKALRDSLEREPTAKHVAAETALTAKTKAQGRLVQEELHLLMAELESAAALVTPAKDAASRR